MIKKSVKLMLVVLILLGAIIATANMFHSNLYSDMKLVKYVPEEPNCYGPGTSCIDMTKFED